jgi:hypothetical protein
MVLGCGSPDASLEGQRRILPPKSFPVGSFAFGGMYSGTESDGHKNPATQGWSCPQGYESKKVLGSEGEDQDLFLCSKSSLQTGELPALDFGGFYGTRQDGEYFNPVTQAMSCSSGYQAHQVYGKENHDFNLWICTRQASFANPSSLGFEGVYGSNRDEPLRYAHPITGELSCPQNSTNYRALGSNDRDWPLHFCLRSLSSGFTLPATSSFEDITFSPEFNRGYVGFGGMFSRRIEPPPPGVPAVYNNPITGAASCPAGYKEHIFRGTPGVYGVAYNDYETILCYRDDLGRLETAAADFGGMWGLRRNGTYVNPLTGSASCPEGFGTGHQLTGENNHEWTLFFCYRDQKKSEPTPYSIGGLYSIPRIAHSSLVAKPNLADLGTSCPVDHAPHQVLGESWSGAQQDANVFMCTKPIEIDS